MKIKTKQQNLQLYRQNVEHLNSMFEVVLELAAPRINKYMIKMDYQFNKINSTYHMSLRSIASALQDIKQFIDNLEKIKSQSLIHLKSQKALIEKYSEDEKTLSIYLAIRGLHETLFLDIEKNLVAATQVYETFDDIKRTIETLPTFYLTLSSDDSFQNALKDAISEKFNITSDEAGKLMEEHNINMQLNTEKAQNSFNFFRFSKDEIIDTCVEFIASGVRNVK